jgi:hypothetical protein
MMGRNIAFVYLYNRLYAVLHLVWLNLTFNTSCANFTKF